MDNHIIEILAKTIAKLDDRDPDYPNLSAWTKMQVNKILADEPEALEAIEKQRKLLPKPVKAISREEI